MFLVLLAHLTKSFIKQPGSKSFENFTLFFFFFCNLCVCVGMSYINTRGVAFFLSEVCFVEKLSDYGRIFFV